MVLRIFTENPTVIITVVIITRILGPWTGVLNAHVNMKNVPEPWKKDRPIFLLHLHILNICEYTSSVVNIISLILIIF